MYHVTISLLIVWGLLIVLAGIWKAAQYATVRYTRPTRQFLLVSCTDLIADQLKLLTLKLTYHPTPHPKTSISKNCQPSMRKLPRLPTAPVIRSSI